MMANRRKTQGKFLPPDAPPHCGVYPVNQLVTLTQSDDPTYSRRVRVVGYQESPVDGPSYQVLFFEDHSNLTTWVLPEDITLIGIANAQGTRGHVDPAVEPGGVLEEASEGGGVAFEIPEF
jgi:hypothetical protein